MPTFYEFFAGGGMVRQALQPSWTCLFANDFDEKKVAAYQRNWGGAILKPGDVNAVTTNDLPSVADLAWASFPCQDLSLAGGGAGLKGARSGTFWPFWRLMQDLKKEGREPRIIALENVCGTLSSHDGSDFEAISEAFASEGYRFGAMVIDAANFLPQSRPRLFFVAVRSDVFIPAHLLASGPSGIVHSPALLRAYARLSPVQKQMWLWWKTSPPSSSEKSLSDILEENPQDVAWHSAEETQRLLRMMSQRNREKVEKAQASGQRQVGCIYKRTRMDETGQKIQRAEIRFDQSGCLRTPAGGSSRQLIMVVEGAHVRSRLISARETARLMGLPDSYVLPVRYNDAYHLTGDGVAVPVVKHLAQHLFGPMLTANFVESQFAA